MVGRNWIPVAILLNVCDRIRFLIIAVTIQFASDLFVSKRRRIRHIKNEIKGVRNCVFQSKNKPKVNTLMFLRALNWNGVTFKNYCYTLLKDQFVI